MTTTTPIPTVTEIEQQEARLVFTSFDENTAITLGTALIAAAQAQAAPVVIDIRTPDRTLFHAALPGAAPDNDHWARRKKQHGAAQAPCLDACRLEIRRTGQGGRPGSGS